MKKSRKEDPVTQPDDSMEKEFHDVAKTVDPEAYPPEVSTTAPEVARDMKPGEVLTIPVICTLHKRETRGGHTDRRTGQYTPFLEGDVVVTVLDDPGTMFVLPQAPPAE